MAPSSGPHLESGTHGWSPLGNVVRMLFIEVDTVSVKTPRFQMGKLRLREGEGLAPSK